VVTEYLTLIKLVAHVVQTDVQDGTSAMTIIGTNHVHVIRLQVEQVSKLQPDIAIIEQ
jgi:hypothetical protein